MAKNTSAACPCGSGFPLVACCMPFIAGLANPPSAESLMRSRYTAYTLGHREHLLRSWHSSTRPARLELDTGLTWIGLRIHEVEDGGPDDGRGVVRFVARCKSAGRARRIEERSRFVKEDGIWYYVDGDRQEDGSPPLKP